MILLFVSLTVHIIISQQNTPSDQNTSLLSPQSATSNKSLTSNVSSSKSLVSPATPVLSPTSKLVTSIGTKIPCVMSPTTPSGTSKSKRRRDREARKNSQHYQESDILESYYRSSPGDKVSDYEDIWNSTDRSNQSTWSPNDKGNEAYNQERLRTSNDRLNPTEKIVSSPAERSSNEKPTGNDRLLARCDNMILRNDKINGNNKFSYKEVTSPEFTSFKPLLDHKSPEAASPEEMGMGKRPDLLSRVCTYYIFFQFF